MPKEAFGGDGDSGGGGGGDKRKPGLSRFGLGQDTNIRDVLWKLMDAYAKTGKPGMELQALEHDRFALMRAALSVLSGKQGEHYGPAPGAIAEYSVMLMVDGGWADALRSFLAEGADEAATRKEITRAIRKLAGKESYGTGITETCAAMLREREGTSAALSYISGSGNAGLSRAVKKELLIIARGGIGEDQMNAIKAISLITEDDDVKKSLIILLSHWDAQARLAAARVLETLAGDSEVREAAARRLPVETDAGIKSILGKIAG